MRFRKGWLAAALILGFDGAGECQHVSLVSRTHPGEYWESIGVAVPFGSIRGTVSNDGRYVAFSTDAADVVPNQVDTPGTFDVYLHDRVTGENVLVSHAPGAPNVAGNLHSYSPKVSGDGNFVVFHSDASNLGAPAGNVFLYERATGNLVLVSHALGAPLSGSNGSSSNPTISADGTFVTFVSTGTNLVAGTDTGWADIFVYERATGTNTLVTHTAASTTTTSNGSCTTPMISGDGAWIAYVSLATNLVAGTDINASADVFLHDRLTNTNVLVSHRPGQPTVAGNNTSDGPSISDTGSVVAFKSLATDLVSGGTDTNGGNDIFLFERATGVVRLVSHTAASFTTAGALSSSSHILSRNGEYVVFLSSSNNLISGGTDTNAASDVFLYNRGTLLNTLVSHTSASPTTAASGASGVSEPTISGDGRWVAYSSRATNLVAGLTDANAESDIFVYDHTTGGNALVSHTAGSPTTAGNGASTYPILGHDGTHVAFLSTALDLVAGIPMQANTHLFVHDRAASTTTLASRRRPGWPPLTSGVVDTLTPSLSGDGRYVVFLSPSILLVTGTTDTNGGADVFLWDRLDGNITLVSHTAASLSAAGNNVATMAAISRDGNWVVFTSQATNHVAGTDINGVADVFLYERATGAITLVSRAASASTTACNNGAGSPSLSADGRWVAFSSFGNNLLAGPDTNGAVDVFLYDRTTGANTLSSHAPGAPSTPANGHSTQPVVSADGSSVVFTSGATNLIGGTDTNGIDDLFHYDRTADLIQLISHTSASVTTAGNGASSMAALSDDGGRVAFLSRATDLVAGTDTNGANDVFVYDLASAVVRLVSHTAASPVATGNGVSSTPAVSGDGQWVGFTTAATNIGGTEGNFSTDVYLYSYATEANVLVSHAFNSLTTTALGASDGPALSTDASFVAFRNSGSAGNLVAGLADTNNSVDVFLFERSTGIVRLVTHKVGSLTGTGNAGATAGVAVNTNGNYVAFISLANNLVLGDSGGAYDAFLYQRSGACQSSGLTATPASGNQIALSWSSPIFGHYAVLRSTSSGGPYTQIGIAAGTTFSDVTPGSQTYYYVVGNDCGTSNEASASICTLPPTFAGATSVAQTSATTCTLRVAWTSASTCPGVTYSVYRSTSPGFTPSASTEIASGLSGTAYDDAAAIAPSSTYRYIVRARNAAGAQDSNLVEVSAVPSGCTAGPPDAVRTLTVRSTNGQNVIQWLNPVAGYNHTRILFRTDMFPTGPADPSATLAGTFPGTPGQPDSTTHTGLVNGTTYYYAAYVDSGVGTFSARCSSSGRVFDHTSGAVKWAFSTGTSSMAPASISGGALYASSDRAFHAMARGAAGGLWPSGWSPYLLAGAVQHRVPIVATTLIPPATRVAFLGAQDGSIQAVNAATGAQLWQNTLPSGGIQATPVGMFTSFGGIVNHLLVGTWKPGDNFFYALDATSGNVVSTFTELAGGIGIVSGSPLVDYPNRRVYFASHDEGSGHSLWCLQITASGTTNTCAGWTHQDLGDVEVGVTRRNGRLYVGNNNGTVYARDENTGAAIWSFDTGDGPVKGFLFPDRLSDKVYFATSTKVWGLDDTGTPAWPEVDIPGPSPVLFTPGSRYLIVGGNDGRLYQLDVAAANPTTPPLVTSVTLGDGSAALGAPTLDTTHNLVYVGSDAGIVYAVQMPLP